MPFSRLSAAALVAGSLISLRAAVAQQAAASAKPATPLSQSLMRVVPRIPDVIGKTIDSAIATLAFTRLPIVRIDTVTSAQPRGRVVVQRPGRGTLVTATKAETLLVAMVARKLPPGAFVSPANGILVPPVRTDTPITHVPVPRDTVVPDLYGRTPNLVSAALETSRLRLGRVVQDSSDQVTAGRAFHQDPPAGTRVGLGRAVDVWYSLGAHQTLDTVSVPSIEGRSITDARLILRRRNLTLGRVSTEYRHGADGTIVHQEPHAGETAHRNDAVDATVVVAPPLIPVPRVVGLSRGDARATIERAGLDVGAISIITRSGATATIDSQRPAADARVEPHMLIDLVEADAPIVRRGIVPSLMGKTQAEAERAIQADSLEVGTVVRPDDDSAAKVIAQDPPGGASVVFHSRVNFRMSARPEPAPTPPTPPPQRPDSFIRVPRVINLTLGDAERVLADAGFSHIGIHGDSATATAVVVAQSPRAGTLARPEALVSIATERIVTRRVPDLIGRRERDARAEAERDRFFMRVANQSRKFRLTEVVVSQTPVAGASDRGDQRIDVDLHIPLVPPVPAAIVLGVAGVAGETFRRRKKRIDDEQPDEREQHVNDNEFVLTDATPPADMPTLASSGGDRLIRSMLEFEFSFEFDSPTWDVESPSNTLIISEKVRHG
jgi:beta-lactam-binding protein with PASTA domain